MRYYIFQLRQDDCGFASFKMLLASFSSSRKALYLTNPKKEGNYTFFDLQQYASFYNMTLKGYHSEDLSSFSCPFIALMKSEEQRFHYVVVDKITSKYVYYRDPTSGKKKEKNKDFFSSFSGFLLAVQNYEKKKIKFSISFFSFHYLFIALYIILSLLLFFFLPSESAFLFSFLSFFLYEQIAKGYLERLLVKRIPCYFTKENHTKEAYSMYLDKTRQYEEYPFSLVQMIGGLYLLFLYGCYTGVSLWKFIIAILIGLFLGVIDKLGQKKEQQIEKMENDLFVGKKEGKNIACYQKTVTSYFHRKKWFQFISYLALFFLCIGEYVFERQIPLSLFIAQFIFHILFVRTCSRLIDLVLQHEKRVTAYLFIQSFYEEDKGSDLPSS